MANNQDMSERKDDPSRIASLYGLTPKVETAINHAVMNGEKRRARILMAPLHPADQADLIERLPMDVAANLVRMLGDDLDAETLTHLNEQTRDEIVDVMGMAALARQLPDLPTDDALNIVEELEQDERADVLAALPAEDRVLVEEGLSFPEDSAGRLMQREVVTVPSFWTVGQTIDFLRNQDHDAGGAWERLRVPRPGRKLLLWGWACYWTTSWTQRSGWRPWQRRSALPHRKRPPMLMSSPRWMSLTELRGPQLDRWVVACMVGQAEAQLLAGTECMARTAGQREQRWARPAPTSLRPSPRHRGQCSYAL